MTKNRRLIIVSSSLRRKSEPITPIPAIDRYDGVFVRLLKKYIREGYLRDADILIVSENRTILSSDEEIPYETPHHTSNSAFGSFPMNPESTERIRQENLKKLEAILRRRKYSEVYVNLGKTMRKLVEGFEGLTKAKVTVSQGKGLGPKARHMRDWILMSPSTP